MTPSAHASPPRRTSRRTSAPPRGPRRSILLIAALALAVAACSGSDDAAGDHSGTDGMGWATMPAPAPAPGMPSGMPDAGFEMDRADGSVGSGPAGELVAGTTADGRAVVRNASIELVVDDGATAIAAVESQVAAFGGSVASATRSREEDGTVSGSLVLRVPAARLDELVDALDALARAVPFRTVDEVDVTLQLSDIEAQLTNLRAFEQELRALLTEAREREGTVEGLVAVSNSLRQVRTEIDLIEARRIQLADRVELSTVYVFVRQARSTTPVIGTWDLPAVVRDALAATVRLGQLAVEGAVWFALTVAPALAVVGVVGWSVRSVRRRRRASRQAPPGAVTPHG
jgi:hypothetical protein